MTGVSDKSKPYKEKGLRGDLSLCHFWHTNIGGGVRVWGQMCVWVVGVEGGQNLTKVLGFFHTQRPWLCFCFCSVFFRVDGWTTLRLGAFYSPPWY